MAGKNDPSIYDDRSTIGSSDELDEYGVWVKSEPQDMASSTPDIEDLPDFDTGLGDDVNLPEPSETEDFSAAGGDLEFEEIPENSDLPEGPRPTSIDGDGFTEVSMTDFLDSETDSVDFGELDSAIPDVDELSDPVSEPVESASAPTASSGAADLSTQLLMKIADELSSIKNELSSLKKELSAVRDGGAKAEAPDSKGGGFFDEEDDEKIALTGDELDNILNTANFTEETGSEESLDDDLSLDIPETETSMDVPLSSQEDIISESGSFEDSMDISFDEGDVSELNGAVKVEDEIKNISDNFDVSMDLSSSDLPDFTEESDELNVLREEGALPISPVPEDTSYLDEDPLASEESVDLSGAVIDEPDLSSGISDNPVSEPAIDNISIDLEMEEQSAPEETSGDFVFETEESMEIPGTEESGTSAEPENFDFSADDAFTEDSLPDEGQIDEGQISEEPFGLDDSAPGPQDAGIAAGESSDDIPSGLKQELKTVLSYMDQLLESLPEDKIEEFAKSEYFDTYKKLFEELGLV